MPLVQVGLIGLTLSRFASFGINVNLNCFVAAKYHKCGKCERLFADEEAPKANMKSKHPDRSIIKKRKCDFCLYLSDRLSSFKYHLLTHTNKEPFECLICCKKFSQETDLIMHIRIHTQEIQYECIECSKKFNQSSSLKNHKHNVYDKLNHMFVEQRLVWLLFINDTC